MIPSKAYKLGVLFFQSLGFSWPSFWRQFCPRCHRRVVMRRLISFQSNSMQNNLCTATAVARGNVCLSFVMRSKSQLLEPSMSTRVNMRERLLYAFGNDHATQHEPLLEDREIPTGMENTCLFRFSGLSLLTTLTRLLALTLLMMVGFPYRAEAQLIFVTNSSRGKIGEYNTSGAVVNAGLVSGLNGPTGNAVFGSNIYVTSSGAD